MSVLVLATIGLSACATVQPAARFTEAQVKVLKAEGFVETAAGWELSVADKLLFASNESQLAPEAIERLGSLGSELESVGVTHLRVEGHTDSTGPASLNKRLSEGRAKMVAMGLAVKGKFARGIDLIGLGSTIPVESNSTRAGRAENRRAVIIVPPQR